MSVNLNYLNKDFNEFNETLIQYIKDRFPNEYKDISQSNPGQIFVSLAAYVGAVNSFYLDNQLQNLLPQYTTDIKSLLAYAYIQGYPVRPTTTATVEVEITQLVPAVGQSGNYAPDYSFALVIPANTVLYTDTNNVNFLTESTVDFSYSNAGDPVSATVHQYDSNTNPVFYAVTKKVKAISGVLKTATYSFTSPKKFDTITIEDDNILFISKVIDTQGNKWYEVPYLGQNTIFKTIPNTLTVNEDGVRDMLSIEKVSKRFVSRFKSANLLEIEFGSGVYNTNDLQIVPTLDAIHNLDGKYTNTYNPLNPHSFMYTKEYGEAPANTTLTFTYVTGGGLQSNVATGTITNLDTSNISFIGSPDASIATYIKNNIRVTNVSSASGGRNALTLQEIRNILIANFASQDRAINKEDYMVRALSLPANFGVVAKAFVQLESANSNIVNIYTLSLDSENNFTYLPNTLKENLSTYLTQYQSLSDKVVINTAYVINVGVDFEITTHNNYTPKEVLMRCITKLQDYFDKSNWQINQPIIISDVIYQLSIIEGVQSVIKVEIKNKYGNDYSNIVYDLLSATQNNVIYPSLDPCIFEVKYPKSDIQGRIKII